MKRFNKLLAASLLALLLLVLGACGNNDEAAEPAENSDNQTEEATETKEKVETKDLILATTTSTQDTGLLDELIIPMFEEQNPSLNVKTIAVGTGQALEMGTKGEADVLLVHAPVSEEELVKSGDAVNRQLVMHNDFIIVGPKDDSAGVKGLPIIEAFDKIIAKHAVFVSRGDDSGTHKKELAIWKSMSVEPSNHSSYLQSGQGMGATLQIANEKNGYTLTDRGTWLAQEKNLTNLQIVVEGDEDLKNIYHVMQVNPEKHDKVNNEGAEKFVEFMINEETQKAIGEFGKDKYAQALFFPDAK
ncbi:substrate-binding domain-containing protein [Niallia endozanthoxylica]|uniref:Tungsten ABC transporter substrate-binding protein n=1 Tax=Niallia endozanthoxylica TaxID=2036016 RepID=A0A5J5HKN4_9BACI|nr:substrate-binding domain-containing protein [Niallia endozanthoxylica]KAA9020002.1 tungsten ABC transporter substrate-binding protein [Niallia endozanthoxylica]